MTEVTMKRVIPFVGAWVLIAVCFASAKSAQSPPTRFQQAGWAPADLVFNQASGMFVLDASGGVSRLVADPQATPRIEKLFQVEAGYSAQSAAASSDSVFVTSNSKLGCTIHRYSFVTKAVSKRLVVANTACAGIATNGSTFYVALPALGEIRYWDSWDAPSAKIWSLPRINSPGTLAFDVTGQRLIVADDSGKLYAVSVADGKARLLASHLGMVQCIATSRSQTIVASGKKVLFIGRVDNRREKPPAGLGSLMGGQIAGVVVDGDDELWFADYDKKLVEGPFPLG
jgi:DNA-binding beta-propeller fold protein YncE